MKNITPGIGENNFYAAVHKSNISLAQAGKIAVSWYDAGFGSSLSCKSTVVDA